MTFPGIRAADPMPRWLNPARPQTTDDIGAQILPAAEMPAHRAALRCYRVR